MVSPALDNNYDGLRIDSIVAKPAQFVYLEKQGLVARATSPFPLRLLSDVGKDAAVDV